MAYEEYMDELRKSFLTALYWSLLKWSRIRLFKLEYEVFLRVRGKVHYCILWTLQNRKQQTTKQNSLLPGGQLETFSELMTSHLTAILI